MHADNRLADAQPETSPPVKVQLFGGEIWAANLRKFPGWEAFTSVSKCDGEVISGREQLTGPQRETADAGCDFQPSRYGLYIPTAFWWRR